MSEPFFTERDWIRRVITFSEAQSDAWKLMGKLSETVTQASELFWREKSTVSEAWATFSCINEADGRDAIMKVRVQIPYKGSLHSHPDVRAEQARRELGYYAKTELDALSLLTEKGCVSAPTLLNHKQEEQSRDMFIPRGYVLYILMNRLPGVPLADAYWQLDATERQEIRDAFKNAYEYVFPLYFYLHLKCSKYVIDILKKRLHPLWNDHTGPRSGESSMGQKHQENIDSRFQAFLKTPSNRPMEEWPVLVVEFGGKRYR